MNESEETDPAAALALVRETRKAAAERVRAPLWYHGSVGAVEGVLVASVGFRHGAIVTALAMCALAVLISQYQKQTGISLNGLTAGGPRSRRLLWLGLVLILGVMIGGVYLTLERDMGWVMLPAGVAVALFATWLGRAWERTFLEEAGA